MADADLRKYCQRALDRGATHAKQVKPSSIVIAPWVRWKCQFGCPNYNRSYMCPPDSPIAEQTRAVINSYHRLILFHTESAPGPELQERRRLSRKNLMDLEMEMFLDGYYKAFVLISGGCSLCAECFKVKGEPCPLKFRARPSMEACSVDVYQTARNNGFPIKVLRGRTETGNYFGLMLVN